LKPGGRLAVADIVATAPLPEEVKGDWAAYTGCMAGASQVIDLEKMLTSAGFESIRIAQRTLPELSFVNGCQGHG
jgi:hypothetical protein